ncbi:uncharacterized protein LOC126741877 [Anthonomus grandis grandis]|uniref:uncharacterized protein LOC126741877 n=1 Tax=Anthonomus grandis grandis TaxID=2921223 RepID=UPI002165C918|nr:uncharacterized protein LOC126741877 [Anthonomus grandis grandis]
MAFVCPAKEETEAVTLMATKVKQTLQQLEDSLNVGVKPICVPCCVPLCEYPPAEPKNNAKKQKVFDPPKVMVCYKETSKKHKTKHNNKNAEEGIIRLHQSKSRELRASILYTGCQCERRDGLQDDCPRTGCHGSPECLTSPPTCGPSEFCDGKHLGKKNKYNYLMQKGRGSHNGNAGNGSENHAETARYKCFAATVDQPMIVPMSSNPAGCFVCPPCI